MADPELQAVESALTALALAETEPALQKVVTQLLPAVLAALSTKSAAARAKCIETLQHINVRVRASPSLKLPFTRVLEVATAPDAALLTTNVAIQGGYLSRCFERQSPPARAAALPLLVDAAEAVASEPNRVALHTLALAALAASAAQHRVADSQDALYRAVAACRPPALEAFLDFGLQALRMKLKAPPPEPALLAVVRLASEYAGARNPERAARVFAHMLVAAGATSRSALQAAGEDALKRIDGCDTLAAADPSIVAVLFDLSVDPLAEIPLRTVVLAKGLLNTTLSASYFPEVVTVLQHALLTPGTPPRLHGLGMQFASFVVKHADIDALTENAAALIELLLKLVRNDTGGSPSFPDRLRAFGFTGLSELVVRIPALLGSHGLTVNMFFDAAQSPQLPPEPRAGASQALVALTRVVRYDISDSSQQRPTVLTTLKAVLENLDGVADSARVAAVQWANECFSFADAEARLLNIIAAGDPKQHVRQLAADGLSPIRWKFKDGKEKESDKMDTDQKLSFADIVKLFGNYRERTVTSRMIEAYLQFAFFVLRHEIRDGGKLELIQQSEIDSLFQESNAVKQGVTELRTVADEVLFGNMEGKRTNLEKAALSVAIFATKVSSQKKDCSSSYARRIDELIALATRKSAVGDLTVARGYSYLVGVATCSFDEARLQSFIDKLGNGLEPDPSGVASGRDKEDERVAKTLCFGQIVMQCHMRTDISLDDTEASAVSRTCLNITRRMQLAVESSDIVRTAVCVSLADIGAVGKLPITQSSRSKFLHSLAGVLKLHSTNTKVAEAAAECFGKVCVGEPRSSFRKLAASTLIDLCKERKEDEIRFASSESLVRASSGYDALPPTALEGGESNMDMKNETASSEALRGVLLMRVTPFEMKTPIADGDGMESEIFSVKDAIRGAMKLVYDERPNARAGGCVCLFTFLRLLGMKSEDGLQEDVKLSFLTSKDEALFKEQQTVLFELLPEMQEAFTLLLGDRSDFVQQLASCGVALVYQLCPPETQKNLVSSLVRSLTAGKARSAAMVPGDQGTLLDLGGGVDVKENAGGPKAGTYKELCSLAQDMGQPELVYKFMDLAGHTALWNSRRGAALAGSALLGNDLAAEQLRPHVKNLLPRLYVYCYDPTESVRVAMSSVLSAVVKAGDLGTVFEAVTAHFDLVTDHCIKSMTSRQWRSREAGCGALRDALTSRTWDQVKERLSEFWYYTLRALDDIKETVRKAAGGTGRALSELSIHLCDPGQVGVDIASAAIAVVMPAIMPAVTHSATEVRILAGSTLMQLIKHGGEALRSLVPELLGTLLETATELEPQELNYVQFHVDDPEALEKARVDASTTSSSPLIDALERLCGLVDESNIEDSVRSLVRMAKVGVGIPTRAATARLFGTLLRTRAAVAQKYSGKLLNAAFSAGGMEMSGSLRASWASAAGVAARLAETDDVGKVVTRVAELAASDDSRERAQASGLALALWRQSPDTARQHGGTLLPVAYMGSHEADDDPAREWREVWAEGAPSTEAGLRVYAREISKLCVTRLAESTQYRAKRGAAAALGELAVASRGGVATEILQEAATSLLSVLPGHVWEGKIVAVEAVGKVADGCEDLQVWATGVDGSVADGVQAAIAALLREAKRGKSEYRQAAIEATGKVARRARDKVPLAETIANELRDVLDEAASGDGSAAGADDDGSNAAQVVWETGSDADAVAARVRARKARRKLRAAAMAAVGGAAVSAARPDAQTAELAIVARAARACARPGEAEWEGRVAALAASADALGRVDAAAVRAAQKQIIGDCVRLAASAAADPGYGAVRRGAMETLLKLTGVFGAQAVVGALDEESRGAVRRARDADTDMATQREARRLCGELGL